LGGPATATFAGRTYVARDGILVTPALELAVVDSDAQGIVDATATTGPVMIQFTPHAAFADLEALYPLLAGEPGTPLFGVDDAPLVLVAANGVRLTFAAAAVVQMPDLLLGARGPVAGSVTFLAIGARALPVTAANRLVTIDTTSAPTFPVPAPQLSDDYVITWGGAPWTNLRARDGVRVSFAVKTRPVLSAAVALLDLTLESLSVTARFAPATPGGPGAADLFAALQVQGAPPGWLLSQEAQPLLIAGQHLWLELPLAQVSAGDLRFDATHRGVGELVFTATRARLGAEAAAENLALVGEGAV
jgi:hypothetical protein